jgi:hypothetical protein
VTILSEAIGKSKAVFKLKALPIIHRVIEIKDELERERVDIFLDSLIDSIQEGDETKTREFVYKIKEKMGSHAPVNKQIAAEEFIRKSGDSEAIGMLDQMKRDPAQYAHRFKNAAKSNSVMKTAFGVFTGMIAANLVMGAINQFQLEQALAQFDAELQNIGGIDNFGDSSSTVSFSDTTSDISSDTNTFDSYSTDTSGLEEDYASMADMDPDLVSDLEIDADMDDAGDLFSDLFS